MEHEKLPGLPRTALTPTLHVVAAPLDVSTVAPDDSPSASSDLNGELSNAALSAPLAIPAAAPLPFNVQAFLLLITRTTRKSAISISKFISMPPVNFDKVLNDIIDQEIKEIIRDEIHALQYISIQLIRVDLIKKLEYFLNSSINSEEPISRLRITLENVDVAIKLDLIQKIPVNTRNLQDYIKTIDVGALNLEESKAYSDMLNAIEALNHKNLMDLSIDELKEALANLEKSRCAYNKEKRKKSIVSNENKEEIREILRGVVLYCAGKVLHQDYVNIAKAIADLDIENAFFNLIKLYYKVNVLFYVSILIIKDNKFPLEAHHMISLFMENLTGLFTDGGESESQERKVRLASINKIIIEFINKCDAETRFLDMDDEQTHIKVIFNRTIIRTLPVLHRVIEEKLGDVSAPVFNELNHEELSFDLQHKFSLLLDNINHENIISAKDVQAYLSMLIGAFQALSTYTVSDFTVKPATASDVTAKALPQTPFDVLLSTTDLSETRLNDRIDALPIEENKWLRPILKIFVPDIGMLFSTNAIPRASSEPAGPSNANAIVRCDFSREELINMANTTALLDDSLPRPTLVLCSLPAPPLSALLAADPSTSSSPRPRSDMPTPQTRWIGSAHARKHHSMSSLPKSHASGPVRPTSLLPQSASQPIQGSLGVSAQMAIPQSISAAEPGFFDAWGQKVSSAVRQKVSSAASGLPDFLYSAGEVLNKQLSATSLMFPPISPATSPRTPSSVPSSSPPTTSSVPRVSPRRPSSHMGHVNFHHESRQSLAPPASQPESAPSSSHTPRGGGARGSS